MPTSNKLSKAQVRDILRDYPMHTQRELATLYKVSIGAINYHVRKNGIKKGRRLAIRRSGRYQWAGHHKLRHRKVLAAYFGMNPSKIPGNLIAVHHRNGNVEDNTPRNLMFMTQSDHMSYHMGGKVDLEKAEAKALAILWDIDDIVAFA